MVAWWAVALAVESVSYDLRPVARGDVLTYIADRSVVADVSVDGVEAEHLEGSGRTEIVLRVLRPSTEHRDGAFSMLIVDEPDLDDGGAPPVSLAGLRFDVDLAVGRVKVVGAPKAASAAEGRERQAAWIAAAPPLAGLILRGVTWTPSPGVNGRFQLRPGDPVTFPVFAEMPDLSIDEGEYVAGAEVGGRVICTITGSVTRELAAASGPVTIILTGVAEMEGSTGWLTSLRHEATVLSARELPDGAAATRGVVTVNERWILGVGGESVEDPAATSPDGPGL